MVFDALSNGILHRHRETPAPVVPRRPAPQAQLPPRRTLPVVAPQSVAVDNPGGSVAVPDLALHPTRHDTTIAFYIPRGVNAEPTRPNLESVAAHGAKLVVIDDPRRAPQDSIFVNWGGYEGIPDDALNTGDAVTRCRNKVQNVQALGDLAPMTVLDPTLVGTLPGNRIVAKRRYGQQGSGKAVISKDSSARTLGQYEIFQEFIPHRREYRVSVLNGDRIVTAMLKKPQSNDPEALAGGFRFDRLQSISQTVADVALAAAQRTGLGYTGVDVVEDLDTGRVLCFETNSAPGMAPSTIRNLYEILEGRG